MRWRRLLIALAIVTAGCNALTGVGDLAVEPSDAGSLAPDAAPVGDATGATTEDAGADVIDATVDDAGPDALADAEGGPPPPPPPPPTSCNALLVAGAPPPVSKLYTIDPDGPGGSAPFEVYCDMNTSGGGWSQVFTWTTDLNTTAGEYTSASPELLNGATSVLLAYRTSTGAVTVATAIFPIPADWQTSTPFRAQNTDVTVSVSVNGGVASPEVLRYGYADFDTLCTDGWNTTGNYGRICIEGTAAPFFDAFAEPTPDYCNISTDQFNTTVCVASRAFSIAVR